MTWQVDVLLPEGWQLEPLDDIYSVRACTPRRSAAATDETVAWGVLELAQDTDLDPLQSDLDLFASDAGEVLMSRDVQRSRVGGRDVLTVLDVTHGAQPEDAGREISRSFCGYLRDPASRLVVRFEMTTFDMLAFEDMRATCTDLLASVQVAQAGSS